MVMDLERLIDQARASGTLDSSGRFTLDLERAWEKLGQFAAPEMGAFVLYLVRAAVGSGSSFVSFRESWGQLGLEFPGEVPEPEHLFDHPLDTSAPRWLQELALGIFLPLSGGVALRAVLETGGQRIEVKLRGAQPSLCLTECPSRSVTRLTLQCRSLWSFLGADSLVRRQCRFASVPVLWNSGSVLTPPPLADLTANRRRISTQRRPGLGLPLPDGPAQLTEDPYDALVGFGKGPSLLVAVVNGVAEELPWKDSLPGARAWVSCPTLRLDLSGKVALEDELRDALHELVLDVAEEHAARASAEQLVELVRCRPGAEGAGLAMLASWGQSFHEARPALVNALMGAALRRQDYGQARALRAELERLAARSPSLMERFLMRKALPVDLRGLAGILEGSSPEVAVEWVASLAGLTFRFGQPLASARLVEMALAMQRFEVAERMALQLLKPFFNTPFPHLAHLTRGRALQFASGGRTEALLLLRTLSPHSHMRAFEVLLRKEPSSPAILEGAADSYRWAAARYNDRALCDVGTFRWRGQYLKRADELYAEALSLGADVGRARAAAAAIPLEGLAKSGPRFAHKRDFKVRRFLELGPDPLLEAEVRAELGEMTRASALLDGCDGLVAEVDRMILERLAGREVSLVDLKLEELVILPARRNTEWDDGYALLQASQNMAPVHERLAARLIRLGELCDRSRRLVLFRTALAVQLRWLGFLDLSRPPSAVLRLKEF